MQTTNTNEQPLLKAIPLTEDDINLITFSLRRMSETTGFANIKSDCEDLIRYITQENENIKAK